MINQVVDEFSHSPIGHGIVHWVDSESKFFWVKAKESAARVVSKNTGKYLSDIEMKVLQGSWQGKTYDEIAKIYGYSAEYLNKDVGNKLWNKLSEALGEKVTKKNFKEALLRAGEEQRDTSANTNAPPPVSPSVTELPFPEGSVALDSPFYIEHCYVTGGD
jgi:hypothetical protein